MATQINLPLDAVDLRGANEIVLVANTPTYVLERLRKSSAVAYVSRTLDTDAIVDALNRMSRTAPTTPQDVVERYVYLVALSTKDPNEIASRIDKVGLEGLEWGEQIRNLIKTEAIPTNNLIVPSSKYASLVETNTIPAANSFLNPGVPHRQGQQIIKP